MKLIKRSGYFPPGGYAFTDAKTGLQFNGLEGSFEDQVRKIIQHRLANSNLYPSSNVTALTFDSVAVELENFTCARLGNNPDYCGSGTSPVNIPKLSGKFCEKCGGALEERLCATCGGRKVVGYTCQRCGKQFDK